MTHFRPILAVCLGLVAVAASACSKDVAAPEELRGWTRTELYSHSDVVDFDRVAAGSDGQRAAWLTRSRGKTDELTVTRWGPSDEPDWSELDLPKGITGNQIVPAAIAVDGQGWTAVAEQRTNAGGVKELVAWSGPSRSPAPPVTLTLPEGQVVSRTLATGRSAQVAAVLALTGRPSAGEKGLPEASSLVLWTAPIGAGGPIEAGAWKPTEPDLGTRLPIKTAAIVGAGNDGLVLAATTRDKAAHLWTSADGQAWKPLDGDLPKDVAEVELLAPLGDGSALVSWATEGFNRSAQVWRFDDGKLTDAGTISGTAEGQTIDLRTATLVGDRLVVGGAAVQQSTWTPLVQARNDEGEWIASDQPDLVGHLDWSVEALAAQGDDSMGAVMSSVPFHIDVSTWIWRRPTDAKS